MSSERGTCEYTVLHIGVGEPDGGRMEYCDKPATDTFRFRRGPKPEPGYWIHPDYRGFTEEHYCAAHAADLRRHPLG